MMATSDSSLNLANTKTTSGNKRDEVIDILRGLAIFTMVAANMAGSILIEPHPFLFRFYGTFAAPTFILLSGMMVARAAQKENRDFLYYLQRGLMIIATGALIDSLIWQLYPFITFDVLYLIGFSMPFAYAASRLRRFWQWVLPLSIFVLTPILQQLLGYTGNLTDLPISNIGFPMVLHQAPQILHHFLIDGWFPLFPWLGFSMLGVALSTLRYQFQEKFVSAVWLWALGVFILGVLLWYLHPGPLYTREGYSELFYPPTYGYITTAVGLILLALCGLSPIRHQAFLRPWQYLGQCSLLIYILHYAGIRFVLSAFWPKVHFAQFIGLYIGFVCVLMGIAYSIRFLKTKYPQAPFLVHFLWGG